MNHRKQLASTPAALDRVREVVDEWDRETGPLSADPYIEPDDLRFTAKAIIRDVREAMADR